MYKYRFSIFTATYNRGNLLYDLYKCIKNQDFDHSQFEWVIVSDGSTDNTPQIVQSFIEERIVNIKFINKKNGGKHTAWRVATKIFEGRYVIGADDDDPITYDMLSIFNRYWLELEADSQYLEFWEIRSRCRYEDGRLVGSELPIPFFDSNYITVFYNLHKGAEMVGCRKVEVLRNEAKVPDTFLFQDKCSNFPEEIRWVNAAKKFKTRFIPEITRTYVIGHDSLSFTKKRTKRPIEKNYNSLIYSLYRINELGDILYKYDKKAYFFTILQLAYSSIRVKEPVLKYLRSSKEKFLVSISYLPSIVINIFR